MTKEYVKYAYYRVKKKRAKSVLEGWKISQEVVVELREDIKDLYFADHLYMEGDRLIGFVVEKKNHNPTINRRGFSVDTTAECGCVYYVYKPNRIFKEGKEFAKIIAEYNSLIEHHPPLETYILGLFGLDRRIVCRKTGRSGLFMNRSFAGRTVAGGDVLVLKVPYTEAEPVPEKIKGLRRIKKSEFIALTEE